MGYGGTNQNINDFVNAANASKKAWDLTQKTFQDSRDGTGGTLAPIRKLAAQFGIKLTCDEALELYNEYEKSILADIKPEFLS